MSSFDDRDRPREENEPSQIAGEGFTFTDPKPVGEPPRERQPEEPRGGDGRPPQGGYSPYYGDTGGWNSGRGPGQNQTGWSQGYGYQEPREEGYRWNFADYERSLPPGRQKPRRSRGAMVFAAILCSAAALGVSLFAGYGLYNSLGRSAVSPSSTIAGEMPPGISIRNRPEEESYPITTSGKLTTAQVAKKVSPSVVGIANYKGNTSFTPSGEGSGIIMTEDGYIVTNAHVVEGAKGLTVMLNNGETYAAQIVGVDTKTDLAVIKIQANNLTYAEFGNSDQVEVGEDAIAIGNPTGMQLANSLTKGVVSAVNRVMDGSAYSIPYIQTDAAINPGNSGGALANEYGQVIGINSAKLVATDYEGIGFAIPINNAMPIIRELMTNGRVTGRAELGLTGQMVDETLARLNGTPSGVGIIEVKPNSDLARKNVAPGDIITKINDKPITDFKTLTDVLATKKPGDTVKLTIYRRAVSGSGQSFDVNVMLIEDQGTPVTP